MELPLIEDNMKFIEPLLEDEKIVHGGEVFSERSITEWSRTKKDLSQKK